jgi:hypothetical protein
VSEARDQAAVVSTRVEDLTVVTEDDEIARDNRNPDVGDRDPARGRRGGGNTTQDGWSITDPTGCVLRRHGFAIEGLDTGGIGVATASTGGYWLPRITSPLIAFNTLGGAHVAGSVEVSA